MSSMQRNKGQRGERELFALLSAELGFVVRRNVDQAREGGADCIQIPGWSVECKRCETLNLNAWWEQAIRQAAISKTAPILFYRKSRQPWRARMSMHEMVWKLVGSQVEYAKHHIIDMSMESAVFIIRESLA